MDDRDYEAMNKHNYGQGVVIRQRKKISWEALDQVPQETLLRSVVKDFVTQLSDDQLIKLFNITLIDPRELIEEDPRDPQSMRREVGEHFITESMRNETAEYRLRIGL